MLNENLSCINKIRYETKEAAENAFKSFLLCNKRTRGIKINSKRIKQYPYKCDFCQGWHLTTKK